MRVMSHLAAVAAAALLAGVPAASQQRPLPDATRFFEATQANMARSQARQSEYAYNERRTTLHTNPFGRLGSGSGTEVYAVTPLPEGGTERRLIERDGEPVAGAAVERRARRARPPRRSAVEDTVSALEFTIDRRERLQGRDAIVVRFAPRPDARPETREGRLARVFQGFIWVDEAEAEVVKVEATAVDDISYGFGLIARLNEGTTVALTRARVDGETWLPTSIRLVGEGRAMIFRKLRVDHVIEWFDYRVAR